MSNGNENGLTTEQWKMVIRRVSFTRFLLTIFASSLSFAAVGGAYVTVVDARIEQNRLHLERVDRMISRHSEKLAGMNASQAATETAAARLEERMSAQAATLQRIENSLERLLSSYEPVPNRR